MIFSPTVPGLPHLINMCADYADTWRFKFGIKKTKCLAMPPHRFHDQPKWFLKDALIENVDALEILGVNFGPKASHVDRRAEKCRRSFHSLRSLGLPYPGCHALVKAHLWKTICQPVLLYGSECIAMTEGGYLPCVPTRII